MLFVTFQYVNPIQMDMQVKCYFFHELVFCQSGVLLLPYLNVSLNMKHYRHHSSVSTSVYPTDWGAIVHTARPTITGSPSHSLAYVGSVIWETHVS